MQPTRTINAELPEICTNGTGYFWHWLLFIECSSYIASYGLNELTILYDTPVVSYAPYAYGIIIIYVYGYTIWVYAYGMYHTRMV